MNSFYYFTTDDCQSIRIPFQESKIGQSSTGNKIKTAGLCYEVEVFPSLDKFRIKPTNRAGGKFYI
jgi:hypothetical protein